MPDSLIWCQTAKIKGDCSDTRVSGKAFANLGCMQLVAQWADSYPVAEFWFIWSDKLGLSEYPTVTLRYVASAMIDRIRFHFVAGFFKLNIFSPSSKTRWIAPTKWDKQLYANLFGAPRSRPMSFSCILYERRTEFSNTLQPTAADGIHTYLGAIELQLEASRSCAVHVQVQTSRSSGQFDVPINAHRLGYMCFDKVGFPSERPALLICLRDDGGGAEALAQLFLEARVCGHAGPSFSWAADLTSLENSTALDIWGTWAGTLDLPGRRPFTISDYHFSVDQRNTT